MNQKKTQFFLPFLFGATLAVGLMLGYKMRDGRGDSGFFQSPSTNTLQEILQLIATKYVDNKKIDSIGETVIPQLLEQLDPHSAYITPEEMTATNDDIAGSYCGIGIEYYAYKDTMFLTNVVKDGPADKAGLTTADQIIGVNGQHYHFSRLDNDSMSKLFRGDCGTKLILNISREGKSRNINLTRNEIPDNSVTSAFMIDSTTGYISIEKFTTRTHAEFMEQLVELNKKGMKKLILDLRNNSGGVLSEATEIADEFLDGDKLITYTEGVHRPKNEIRCRRTGQFEKGQLIVLCNKESASASEILMGALQDWDRATIIGERSFGKGLVQEIFDLSNGGALKLTVSRYYTPLGRCIQRSYQDGTDAYYETLFNRSNDSNEVDKKHVFTSPKGKKLFANNGIKPDILLKHPSDSATSTVEAMINKGLIYFYCRELIKTNYRHVQPEKQKAVDILSSFTINPQGWNRLSDLAKESGIAVHPWTDAEKVSLTSWVKATLSRAVWGNNQTYELGLREDSMLIKCHEVFNK